MLKVQFAGKKLLVVSPHFRLFIKKQVVFISSFFAKVTMLLPQPYFPKLLLRISYFNNRLLFLKNAAESCNEANFYNNIDIICPKFFTLPVEVTRRFIPLHVARSSINMVKERGIKFNLIHAHRLDVGFTGAVLKDLYYKPLIITCHGSDVYDFPFKDNFRQAIAKYTISKVDHVIAVCKSDAEKLSSLGLSSSKLSIIPNGFDDNLFKPIPQQLARKKLSLPLNRRILLSIGTLHSVKGHTYLIDAMNILSKVRNDILAVIVGSGPLETKLREKIKKLSLENKVLLVGWEPHNKIPLWLNASDIFVLPSLNEGFPTVIPEAMACGKPIIGTKVGGIPDVITNDGVGVLVKPCDSELLAQLILEALNRNWKSEKIQNYAQKYSLKNIVKQILQVYNHVLNDQK